MPGFNPDGTPIKPSDDGTGQSQEGSSAAPGNGGMTDPEFGCIMTRIPIGIRGFTCWYPMDINPNSANVIAQDGGDDTPPT